MFFFFFMESSVFWMSRVIGVIAKGFLWRLVCSKPRVLVERSHKPLNFLGFVHKTQIGVFKVES